ncbi:MAG: TIGR00282 family metallophosphoesterase [bacterium JZ-2024 1]
MNLRILILGDIVGAPGRAIISEIIPGFRRQREIHLVVANAENASGGRGLTRANAMELLQCGVDVITLGDHCWDKRDIVEMLEKTEVVLRPANYPPGAPGKGYSILSVQRQKVGIMVLQTRVFMGPLSDCPFRTADAVLERLRAQTSVVLAEIHGEATSEKVALGIYLDGRVSVIYGTHTHVPTDDLRILERGSAYITDIGMTGPTDGVIGMEGSEILQRFTTGVFTRFKVARGKQTEIMGILAEVDSETGRPVAVEKVRLKSQYHGEGKGED